MSKLRSAGRHSTKDIPQKIRSFPDLVLLTKSLPVRFVVFCAGVLLMLAAVPATAQEVSTAPVEASDERLESEAFVAPVVVDGQELFVVRGSSALPANERA